MRTTWATSRTALCDDTIGIDCEQVHCPHCAGAFLPILEYCPDDGARLIRSHAPRDPMLGTIIDRRFRLVRRLGEGGMGLVYEALQSTIGRRVAIKLIRDELNHDHTTTRRFLREGRLLASINHPNIVGVFDCGETESGALFLVMELLDGETLEAQLATVKRFSARRTCEVAVQLCDALAAAHQRGIVHRDLKPANIVVVEASHGAVVKVLDFGIAKSLASEDSTTQVTQAGMVIGTPLYMAPEAISAEGSDPRTDLYALGCIVHEMVVGAPPFVSDTLTAILTRQLHEPPPPLPADVPPALATLVHALLAKSPDQRPASAAVARARFQAILDRGDGRCELDDEPTLHHAAVRPRPRGSGGPPDSGLHRSAADHSHAHPRLVTARHHLGIAAVMLVLLVLAFAITLALRA